MEVFSLHLARLRAPRALRVLRGSLAQGYDQAVTIFIQLASVPVLLRHWGADGYGTWLILSAIPSYLALSDLGFVQIAANEMAMEVGAGNFSSARKVFQSVMMFVAVMGPLILVGFSLLVFSIPVAEIFKLKAISPDAARAVLLILSAQIVTSLFFGVIGAGLRAVGQFALMVFLIATSRLLEQLAVLLLASVGGGIVLASGIMLFVKLAFTCIAAVMLLRSAPWMSFGVDEARIKIVRRLFVPSVTYMFYGIGTLINIQGVTLIVAGAFGPMAVTTFSVMRTLARLGPTVANTVSHSLVPEYSTIFGSGRLGDYRSLVKGHVLATLLLCAVYVVSMLSLSHWIIQIWTSDRVSPIEPLLTLMIIACAAEMIWSSGQWPLVSISKHKVIGLVYLLISAVSIAVMKICTKEFGIDAIGIISVVTSVIMIVITLIALKREAFAT